MAYQLSDLSTWTLALKKERKYAQFLVDCPTTLNAAAAVSSKLDKKKQKTSRMTHKYCKLSLQEDRWRIVTLETAEGSESINRKIGSCPLHPESCGAEPAGHALPLIAFPALGCGSCCAEGVTDL